MNEAPDPSVPARPTEPNLPSDRAAADRPGFKGFKDAYKALRAVQPPMSDDVRNDYISRVRACPSARYIAFRLLSLRAVGEMQTKLTPFIASLEEILYAGTAPIDLRNCESIEALRGLVADRLATVRDKKDLKRFASTGSHLPIMYGIVRAWDDPVRFQAGLEALASAFDRLNNPKRSDTARPSNSLEIVARGIVTRVPEKPLIGKALPEILKIGQSLFRQAEETNRDNLALQSQLAAAEARTQSAQEKLEGALQENAEVRARETSFRADVAKLRSDLEREKEHFERLKGHAQQDRERAISDAVARLRSEVSRRLGNIRLFADREQPNRQGILNLVSEIAEALTVDRPDT